MFKFNRITVTQEMIDGMKFKGLYPWSSKPGIYVEKFDGRGDAWLQPENSQNSSIITCSNCQGEFVNNSAYADSDDVCPHCGHTRETKKPTIATKTVATQQERMVTASCGHTIPATQLLDTSNGSSCPGCYDRLSN